MDDQVQRERRVAEVFDAVATDYDQSGVAFFAPIAEGLVDALAPTTGERVVDVGCGRGAATFPAARAVGETGSVTALDLSAAMVELTRRGAEEQGLLQVHTRVVTSDDLGLPDAGADVLLASLVLFFSADPATTLRSWVRLLAPGGRLGLATFGVPDPTWARVDALFHPYLPPQMLDARTSGEAGPFESDQGLEELCGSCGARDLRSQHLALAVRFRDAEQWRAFSMGTGQRMFWGLVPEERRPSIFSEAAEILEGAREPGGDIVLTQDVRYTLATV